MKSRIVIILLMLIFIAFGNICHAQDHKLTSVKVEIVDLDMETDVEVSCEDFKSAFKDTKKSKDFHSEREMSEFRLLIKYFRPAQPGSLDVRGSIAYSYGKTNVKYCFDGSGYFYNDGKLYFNKQLLIYILDKMYTYHHPKYLDTLRQHE